MSFSENTNNLPMMRNVSILEREQKDIITSHGSLLGQLVDKNAQSQLPHQLTKNDLSNVTGFDNLLGYTQQFNMDSNNMSLGATTNNNVAPSQNAAD